MGMLPTQGSQPYAATRLTSSVARGAFGFLANSPALFPARGFADLTNEANILHPEPASGQFHPLLMHAQGTRQTLQELPGLLLGYPDAAGLFSSFLLQQQLQQPQLMQDSRQQRQQMQHTNGPFAAGGFATYVNPFSERERMNDVSATTSATGLHRAFSSSLPPSATNDPSHLQRHSPTPLSSLLLDEGQSAAFICPSIAAGQDSSSSSAVMPSARLGASTPERMPGGLQMTLDPFAHLYIPKPRTEDLYMLCDDNVLSVHQIILRKQIEFFVAQQDDIDNFTPNRRKEISIGQVGIRCRHCAAIPHKELTRGSMYFPATLRALYQAAQNMASVHFTGTCVQINPRLKVLLIDSQERKAVMGHGGKKYWAERAGACGVFETEKGLRFRDGN